MSPGHWRKVAVRALEITVILVMLVLVFAALYAEMGGQGVPNR